MKRFFRTTALTLAFLLALFALWAGITAAWLRGSLPQLSGDIRVAGASAPIRIVRDRDGVPHIFAASRNDALFGLGFVHGQDRLWQMEFQRRTVQGRLSEILGASTLLPDIYLRTLGLHRAAQSSAAHLAPDAIDAFRAYAAGVNASLPARSKPLPPEFFLLGVRPEPWSPADSVAALKGVALQLSANGFQELVRMQLLRKLSPDQIRGLMPPLPDDVLKAYQRYAPKPTAKFADSLRALLASNPIAPTGASNNWVVGGARTRSGKPMLANDPHLGLTVPGFWYLAHLHWPGHDAIGGTIPGVPGIVAGRTNHIAWGMTTTGADTQDLYWERLDPDSPLRYMAPGGARAFDVRREVIKVRLGSDRVIKVLASRHGPVLPTDEPRLKALVPEGYALSLSWPALSGEDHTGETLLRILEAQDASPRSIEYLFAPYTAPIQSFVYADTSGNTGLILPGKIPVRDPANAVTGLLPGDGTSTQQDWKGFLEGADRPLWPGGPGDTFVTANNNVVPPGYKPMIALDFDAEHRARRIKALLTAQRAPFDTDSFKRIQLDDGEQLAVDILPGMLAITGATDAPSKAALAALATWDRRMTPDRAEPLIYAAWMRQFTRELLEDELGDLFKTLWTDRPNFLTAVVNGEANAITFCDDIRTTDLRESCGDIMSHSLTHAMEDLERRFGTDMASWRWGAAHKATFSHMPFGLVPGVAQVFGLKAEIGGGNSTIQRAAYRYGNDDPFAAVHGSGYRAIYDLGAEERSIFMASTGQSGNLLSPYYANLTPRWARGEYLPMTTNEDEINANSAATITLVPIR